MFIEHRENPTSASTTGKHKVNSGKMNPTLAQDIFLQFTHIHLKYSSVQHFYKRVREFQSRNCHKMKHLKRCNQLIFLKNVGSALQWIIQWTLPDLGTEQTFPSWSSGSSGGSVVSLIFNCVVLGLMLTCSEGSIQYFFATASGQKEFKI